MHRRPFSQTQLIKYQIYIIIYVDFLSKAKSNIFSQDRKTCFKSKCGLLTFQAQGAWPPSISADKYKETLWTESNYLSIKDFDFQARIQWERKVLAARKLTQSLGLRFAYLTLTLFHKFQCSGIIWHLGEKMHVRFSCQEFDKKTLRSVL